MVLLDLPDHDSVNADNRAIVDRVVPMADLLVWVMDPQKYADNAVHSAYLAGRVRSRPAVARGAQPSRPARHGPGVGSRARPAAAARGGRPHRRARDARERAHAARASRSCSTSSRAPHRRDRWPPRRCARTSSPPAASLSRALARDADPHLPGHRGAGRRRSRAPPASRRLPTRRRRSLRGAPRRCPPLLGVRIEAVERERLDWVDAATHDLPVAWHRVVADAVAPAQLLADEINAALDAIEWPHIPRGTGIKGALSRPARADAAAKAVRLARRRRGALRRRAARRGADGADPPGVSQPRRAHGAVRARAPRATSVPRRRPPDACPQLGALALGHSVGPAVSLGRKPHRAARVEEGAMNDLTVTVTGWVATEPKLHVVPERRRPRELPARDHLAVLRPRQATSGSTATREWFTVRVFRAAAVLDGAFHAQGPARRRRWAASTPTSGRSNAGPRTDLVIDAQTVGHDLTRGIADFTSRGRRRRTSKLAASGQPRPRRGARSPHRRDAGEVPRTRGGGAGRRASARHGPF